MVLKCKMILWIAKYLDKLIEKLCNRFALSLDCFARAPKNSIHKFGSCLTTKSVNFSAAILCSPKKPLLFSCFKFVMRTKICEWKGHWYNLDYFQILGIDQLVVVDIYVNLTNAISFCLNKILRPFNIS